MNHGKSIVGCAIKFILGVQSVLSNRSVIFLELFFNINMPPIFEEVIKNSFIFSILSVNIQDNLIQVNRNLSWEPLPQQEVLKSIVFVKKKKIRVAITDILLHLSCFPIWIISWKFLEAACAFELEGILPKEAKGFSLVWLYRDLIWDSQILVLIQLLCYQ